MPHILLSISYDLFILIGLGIFSQNLIFGKGGVNLNDAIIPGCATLGILAATTNFIWAEAGGVAIAVFVVAFLGFTLSLRYSLQHKTSFAHIHKSVKTHYLFIILSFLVVGLCIVKISHTQPHADTGLYHLPAIIWGILEPLPLGLAALHDRFGLNSIWHITASATSFPGTGLSTPYALNGALAIGSLLLFSWYALNRHFEYSSLASLFFGIVISTLNYQLFNSPNTDLPATLFTLISFFYALKLCEDHKPSTYQHTLFNLITCASLATAVKISQFPVLFLPLYFLLEFRKLQFSRIQILLLGVLLLLVWIARGVWISGCLAFPIAATCIKVLPWTLPSIYAENITLWIRAFAREPGTSDPTAIMSNWEWVTPWMVRNNRWELMLLFMIFTIGIVFQLWALLKRKAAVHQQIDLYIIWFTSLTGLIIWFFQAPDIRFGYGFIICSSFLSLIIGMKQINSLFVAVQFKLNWRLVVFTIFTSPLLFGIIKNVSQLDLPMVAWPIIIEPKLHPNLTLSGEIVFDIPDGQGMCWAKHELCTPQFNNSFHTELFYGKLVMRVAP